PGELRERDLRVGLQRRLVGVEEDVGQVDDDAPRRLRDLRNLGDRRGEPPRQVFALANEPIVLLLQLLLLLLEPCRGVLRLRLSPLGLAPRLLGLGNEVLGAPARLVGLAPRGLGFLSRGARRLRAALRLVGGPLSVVRLLLQRRELLLRRRCLLLRVR